MSESKASKHAQRLKPINPDELPVTPVAEGGSGTKSPTVPISSIAYNPRNPRKRFPDLDIVVESIEEVGLLNTLGVIPVGRFNVRYPGHEEALAGYSWVLVHGHQRLAACRRLGWSEVPVHVLESLVSQLDEAALIENIYRTALDPLEEAEALQMLVEKHQSQRKAAEAIRKSQTFISHRLSLLRLPEVLKQALLVGTLTVETARAVAALPAEEQQRIADAGPPYKLPDEASPATRKPKASAPRRRSIPATSAVVVVKGIGERFDTDEVAEVMGLLADAYRDKLSPEQLEEMVRRLTGDVR